MTLSEIANSLNSVHISEEPIVVEHEGHFEFSGKIINHLHPLRDITTRGDERTSGVEILKEIIDFYPEYLGNEEYLKLRKFIFEDLQNREYSYSPIKRGRDKYTAILYNDKYNIGRLIREYKIQGLPPESINAEYFFSE